MNRISFLNRGYAFKGLLAVYVMLYKFVPNNGNRVARYNTHAMIWSLLMVLLHMVSSRISENLLMQTCV